MRKIDKKVSQNKQKRYFKNLFRKQNHLKSLKNHVEWLDTLMKAGKEIDMDKLTSYQFISKLTGEKETVQRNSKDVKFIIDRLVSRNGK
jgi:hypothetical protein